MFKLITDLTDRDKRWFMEMYKRDVLHTYDTTWDEWEKELADYTASPNHLVR